MKLKLLITLSFLLILSTYIACDSSASTVTSVTDNGNGTYNLVFDVCFAGSNTNQGDSHGFYISLTGANVTSSSPSSFTSSSTISASISGNTVTYGPWSDNSSPCFVCLTDAQQCITVNITADALPTGFQVGGQEYKTSNPFPGPCRTNGTIIAPLGDELVIYSGDILDFNVVEQIGYNELFWEIDQNANHSHYILEKSIDLIQWTEVGELNAILTEGNKVYKYIDNKLDTGEEVIHYKIDYFDANGNHGHSKIISVKRSQKLIKVINYLGQDVDSNYKGNVIEIYEDGSTRKVFRD